MRKTLVSFLGGLALVAAMALPAGAAPVPSVHHGGGGHHVPRRGYQPGHDRPGRHDFPGRHDHYRWGPGPSHGYPHYGPYCPPMSCPYGSF